MLENGISVKDPLDYGFDINIGGDHRGAPGSYYPPYGRENIRVNIEAGKSEYLTDLIMEKNLNFFWIKRKAPFFLHYTPYAVHTPIHPVDSLLYKYEKQACL